MWAFPINSSVRVTNEHRYAVGRVGRVTAHRGTASHPIHAVDFGNDITGTFLDWELEGVK